MASGDPEIMHPRCRCDQHRHGYPPGSPTVSPDDQSGKYWGYSAQEPIGEPGSGLVTLQEIADKVAALAREALEPEADPTAHVVEISGSGDKWHVTHRQGKSLTTTVCESYAEACATAARWSGEKLPAAANLTLCAAPWLQAEFDKQLAALTAPLLAKHDKARGEVEELERALKKAKDELVNVTQSRDHFRGRSDLEALRLKRLQGERDEAKTEAAGLRAERDEARKEIAWLRADHSAVAYASPRRDGSTEFVTVGDWALAKSRAELLASLPPCQITDPAALAKLTPSKVRAYLKGKGWKWRDNTARTHLMTGPYLVDYEDAADSLRGATFVEGRSAAAVYLDILATPEEGEGGYQP